MLSECLNCMQLLYTHFPLLHARARHCWVGHSQAHCRKVTGVGDEQGERTPDRAKALLLVCMWPPVLMSWPSGASSPKAVTKRSSLSVLGNIWTLETISSKPARIIWTRNTKLGSQSLQSQHVQQDIGLRRNCGSPIDDVSLGEDDREHLGRNLPTCVRSGPSRTSEADCTDR